MGVRVSRNPYDYPISKDLGKAGRICVWKYPFGAEPSSFRLPNQRFRDGVRYLHHDPRGNYRRKILIGQARPDFIEEDVLPPKSPFRYVVQVGLAGGGGKGVVRKIITPEIQGELRDSSKTVGDLVKAMANEAPKRIEVQANQLRTTGNHKARKRRQAVIAVMRYLLENKSSLAQWAEQNEAKLFANGSTEAIEKIRGGKVQFTPTTGDGPVVKDVTETSGTLDSTGAPETPGDAAVGNADDYRGGNVDFEAHSPSDGEEDGFPWLLALGGAAAAGGAYLYSKRKKEAKE